MIFRYGDDACYLNYCYSSFIPLAKFTTYFFLWAQSDLQPAIDARKCGHWPVVVTIYVEESLISLIRGYRIQICSEGKRDRSLCQKSQVMPDFLTDIAATAVSIQVLVRLLSQSKFRGPPPRLLQPGRVIYQLRRSIMFTYTCLREGGTLSEVPAGRILGMRAFGRGLPIGDSSNFIVDSDKASYW